MKRRFLLFAALALTWLGGTAVAEDYNMPQWGYVTKTVTKGSPITFYDNAGTGSFASSTFNSQSAVVFQPATEGYAIKVTFESLELYNYNHNATTSWKCYLKVYDGTFAESSMSKWPTSGSSVNEFPDNAQIVAYYKGEDVINPMPTLTSGAADGSLSFCFYAKDPSSTASPGWKATVEEVLLETMTVKSAAGNNSFVNGEVWAGKANVGVAGFGITTEGYSSPDKLSSFTFTCSNAAVLDPTTLKLYAGQAASVAGLAEIAGTITENAGVYTYTLTTPQALGNGANNFCLGGDILAAAAFNTTTAVNITGIATVGNFTTFTPATPTTLTVQPMYLMAKDATYDIDQPTQFYDDGGKEGKRSNSFTGHTTFRPTTSGKKVQINFSTISLFYTSSAVGVGNQDVLKIYNGTSVNEANLLYTVEAASMSNLLIKSTSDDGALTVYLATKTPSETMKGDGWEAVVSEFTPQAMTITGAQVTKNTLTACAAQTGVQLLGFNIQTVNTEPALALKSLTLNAGETAAQIKNAKVYYTGVSNQFATTTQVATTAVSAAEIVLTAGTAQTLREGDNWFWVVLDIADKAANGTSANVQLTKVSFADNSEYTTFSNPEGGITINNVICSTEGTKTYDIFDTWQFTHTRYSQYSDNYAVGTTNQITIFRPTTPGCVIQLNFADFKIYYSYYKAKFEVYNGEGTSGTKLYEVTSSELASTVPPVLRSTSGALTVVFNPNTSYSSYNEKGWHATVSEYLLQDMSLNTISVEQASTKLVKLGEAKAALLNLDVNTLGTLNPLTLEALNVNLKGSEANISKVYLMQGTTVLAEADAAANVTLTLTTPVELAEYDNNFVIAVDIKDDATIDATVDAALTSVTLSGNVTAVTDGDPEGSRPVKNVLNLAAGDNGTVIIGENSLMFFDDGGAEGDYTSNFDGYVTFKPANEGYAVELVFRAFDIAYLSGDPFHVFYSNAYDPGATPDKKYGMYAMPAENESVISRAEDGSITVHVTMPNSVKAGFEVEVRQHLLTPLVIDNVTVTSLAPAEATKGTGDIRLLQVAVTVSGDLNPITITGFEQTASDLLLDQHIYATGHSTTFATGNEFTGNYVIDEKGVFYFWFVGSIDTDAEEGDEVTLQLNNVVCGENKIAPETAVVASIDVVSGAHGYYQIGSSYEADYPTLTAALTVIASIGMDGAVTLAVENGTYTEQVTIPEISGAGAANTLTIRSVSGNYNDVTYQYNNALSQTQGVFTINGADYITVQGISFTSTYTSNQTPTLVVVNNASNHVTIDNCHFYADRKTEYSARLDLLRVDAGENLFNNDFTLTNSVFEGGYMGLAVAGHKAAADPLQQNMLIQGNTFRDQGKQQVYGDAVANLQILNNTFRMNVTASNQYAIDWLLVGETATIANNDFLFTTPATSSQSSTPIYIRPNSYQDKENAEIRIINNVINVQNAGTYASYGINFNSNLPRLLLAYNTVVTNTPATAASPFYFNAEPAAGSRFVNNIFQALNKGYAVRYKNATVAKNVTYEHNLFYTSETFGMPTVTHGTFADWKTAIGATDEQANLNEAAVFASDNILLLRQDNGGHLLTAQPLEFATTDITDKVRSATPTIGAYEYDPDMLNIPVLAEGYPKAQTVKDVSADIAVKADNIGSAKVLVLAASAEVPTVETVLAQGTEMTLAKDVEAAITINGLTEETSYKAYVVTLSPVGDAADAVAATAEFTTAWTLRPVELNVIANQTVAENTAVALTATLTVEYDQAKPYTYSWFTAFDATEIGNEATLNITATRATEYICKVTDYYGQYALVSTHVLVTKAAAVATFEEYNIPVGGHKMVEEVWANNIETYLYSGTYAFANVPNKTYSAFNGYVISADNSTEFTGNYMIDQFRSAAGGAYEGNNFGVAYYAAPSSWFEGYTDPVTLTNSDEPQIVPGFYITNSVYTLDAILHGEYANPAFSEGDYLKLTVHGYNGSTPTGNVEFYLADYRSSDPAEHYVIDEWKYLDLSSLGAVTRIEYDMFTTKSDAYGFTTPTYFCFDNFGEERLQTYTRNGLTMDKMGTICLPWAAPSFEGATFYKLLYKELKDNQPYNITLEEVTALEAGKPYVFVAEDTELKVHYYASTEVTIAGKENGLQGTFVNITDGAAGSAGNLLENNYMIYNNTFKRCGANCRLQANRAYILMDEVAVKGSANAPKPRGDRRHLVIGNANAPQTPTGMETVQTSEADIQKVLIDGQLYIIRDNEVYTITGQMVK